MALCAGQALLGSVLNQNSLQVLRQYSCSKRQGWSYVVPAVGIYWEICHNPTRMCWGCATCKTSGSHPKRQTQQAQDPPAVFGPAELRLLKHKPKRMLPEHISSEDGRGLLQFAGPVLGQELKQQWLFISLTVSA